MTPSFTRHCRINAKTTHAKKTKGMKLKSPSVMMRFRVPTIPTKVVKPKRYAAARTRKWSLSGENAQVNGTLLNLKKKASTRKTATTASNVTCRKTDMGVKRKHSRIADAAR